MAGGKGQYDIRTDNSLFFSSPHALFYHHFSFQWMEDILNGQMLNATQPVEAPRTKFSLESV